jgi:chromosome segregation ATPase
MATPMSHRDPSLEQRTSELQVQIEQIGVALQQLRQSHDSLQQMESRLAEMTSECAGILDRWAKTDERHATAVAELHGRLSEWNDLERKLLSESATRIYQFERGVQHEWHALRQKHEEPLQKLDAQASRIAENCLTAVDAALRGFDRAETRLLALEQEMQRQMADLSREVREALGELRQPALHLGPSRSWPLEDVVRLHSELRAEANATDDPRVLEEASAVVPPGAIITQSGSAELKFGPTGHDTRPN